MKKNSKKVVTTESNKPDSTERVASAAKALLMEYSVTWNSLAAQVNLTRRDIHRLVLGTSAWARTCEQCNQEPKFMAAIQVDADYIESARALDEILRINADEFVLITKAEYDQLTQPKAESVTYAK